jgi:hypothetical protein
VCISCRENSDGLHLPCRVVSTCATMATCLAQPWDAERIVQHQCCLMQSAAAPVSTGFVNRDRGASFEAVVMFDLPRTVYHRVVR